MYNKQKIEERDLLQELKNGNSLAFQKLYNTYFALLYLHATHKLHDREAAKDIVHDLFASIWQNRYTLAIQGEISAYLHSAIRYRVIDHIAKEQSKTKYLASLPPITTHHTRDTDHSLREKLLQEQIDRVLNKLSPRVREVFELSREHYLSHKDIAKKLNLSEHSVRSYMKEALRLLRSKLGSLLWVSLLFFCKIF
ncbi:MULTISPECIES: RNA polymerase sigma-70 factor [Sphingobacterium]|uniref:RNA polymerase sigma-70 factor n=1 Tax=Sphingobacterium multivorum TaxID=28454 RepID=A0ABX7CKG4_SPHMU|nr:MULTISPECIES: RNA polymerase sigma-70 factor [Sphingobacterium]QQT31820.1 RNA polymerase sigma-70 factor [Sphingobacterium multivorum]QQT52239.1 RNA polymerase sigma-70 factor [Sphingobacterium multivorum]WET69850.1 MAG: RNA polymerase sigma-70 factor [Sphingobacterium sp.]